MSIYQRLQIEQKDRIRQNPSVRGCMAAVGYLRARLQGGTDAQSVARRIFRLSQAARISPTKGQMIRMESAIRDQLKVLQGRPFDWAEFCPQFKRDRIEKAVVLKPWVSPREKGVLLISFEYQWARLAQLENLHEFADRYTLVLAPTWSPPHSIENSIFPAIYPGRLFYLISNVQDQEIFPRVSPNITTVPLYASNWVNPDIYTPVPFAQKDLDIVMLANFGTYKRHFDLFRALRDLPRNLKILLLGQRVGSRTPEVLMREAADYGVADRFELIESASDKFVNDAFARSKISLLLSKQEGSCVAVVESMFANTPVGIYEDAIIGSKAFVNSSTGRLLRNGDLAPQILEFLAQADTYSPREWVQSHDVSCFGSTKTLNAALRDAALAEGAEWTQDIAVHHWRHDPVLVFEEDRVRLACAFQDIRDRFGFALGKDPV